MSHLVNLMRDNNRNHARHIRLVQLERRAVMH